MVATERSGPVSLLPSSRGAPPTKKQEKNTKHKRARAREGGAQHKSNGGRSESGPGQYVGRPVFWLAVSRGCAAPGRPPPGTVHPVGGVAFSVLQRPPRHEKRSPHNPPPLRLAPGHRVGPSSPAAAPFQWRILRVFRCCSRGGGTTGSACWSTGPTCRSDGMTRGGGPGQQRRGRGVGCVVPSRRLTGSYGPGVCPAAGGRCEGSVALSSRRRLGLPGQPRSGSGCPSHCGLSLGRHEASAGRSRISLNRISS